MDLFIDTACGSDQAAFVRQALNDVQLNGKKSGKSSKKVAAAYEEHIGMIESLRKDLKQSKHREKALLEEFTRKIEQLQRDSGLLPSSFQVLASSTDLNDQDMPMDEMAETARLERNLRTIENIQLKGHFEEYQKVMTEKLNRAQVLHRQQMHEMELEIDRLKRVLIHKNAVEGIGDKLLAPGILSLSDESFDSLSGGQTSLNMTTDSSSIDEAVQNITPLQRLRSQSGPSSNFNASTDWQRLLRLINSTLMQNRVETSVRQEEQDFLDSLKSLVNKVQDTHIDVIQSLKSELEMTSEELHMGEKKLRSSEQQLAEKDIEIMELKNLLDETNDRLKTQSNIQGYLKLVGKGPKKNVTDNNEEHDLLVEKLRQVEEERDALLASNAESDESLSAMQRVMADLAEETEAIKHRFDEELVVLKNENLALKRNLTEAKDLGAAQEDIQSKDLLIKTLQEKIDQFERTDQLLLHDLKDEITSLKSQLTRLKEENAKLKMEAEDAISSLNNILPHMTDQENTIAALISEKEELNAKILSIKKDLDRSFDPSAAKELLSTAKGAHEREQKLEEELKQLRALLENANSTKAALKERLEKEVQVFLQQKLDAETKLRKLRVEIIDMKEEKLTFTTRLREAESSLERANRILTLIQETNDSSGLNEVGALSDLKNLLKEQQDLHSQLMGKGDHDLFVITNKLSGKVHTIQCLLETGLFGFIKDTSVSKLDLSSGISHKEKLLEQSLIFQRNENDRIKRSLEELQVENTHEIASLTDELVNLKSLLDLKSKTLSEHEEALSTLSKRLNAAESGYISDDGSEDDEHDIVKLHKVGLKEMVIAKEQAEKSAKDALENLANAKAIISSLEESNKKMNGDLRSRLQDSNAAIVSLLEQNCKFEKETKELKDEIERLKSEPKVTSEEAKHENVYEDKKDTVDTIMNSEDYIGEIDASFHNGDTDDEN